MCARALLLLLAALPALAGPRGAGAGEGAGAGPAFAARQHTSVLARAGDAAALRCRVLRLAGRAVSWVRSSDLQILSHAGAVFTADARVSCAEAPDAGDATDATDEPVRVTSRDGGAGASAGASVHTLRIERLRASDAGRYECQLNTEPKMSLFFNLTVVESSLPEVVVRALGPAAGEGVVRGSIGGSAQLACEARYSTRHAPDLAPELLAALPALRVRWTRDGDALDPQSSRGGVSLDTERWAGRVVSRLTVAQLRAGDAGRYTCSAAPEGGAGGGAGGGGARASLALRLRPGTEAEMEAMQRDQAVARVSASHAASAARGAPGVWLALLLPLFLT